MSVDPGPPPLSTQAERELGLLERVRDLGAPMDAIVVTLRGQQPQATIDGMTLLTACVAAFHHQSLDAFPLALRTTGQDLLDSWRRYPQRDLLTAISLAGARPLDSLLAIGQGLEYYHQLLDQLCQHDEQTAPELLGWCRELVAAWPLAAFAAGRKLNLESGTRVSPPVPARTDNPTGVRKLFDWRRKSDTPWGRSRALWCIVPSLEAVRLRRATCGEQGVISCGLLAVVGCVPQVGQATLVQMTRTTARDTAKLGVCIAGRCDQISAETAATVLALYDDGMDPGEALVAAQLIEA